MNLRETIEGGRPLRTATAGAALLLVLLAVVAFGSASVAILSVSAARLRTVSLDGQEQQVRTLRDDALALAARWLAAHGHGLATPAGDPYRPLQLIGGEAGWREQRISVQVLVWDASAGAPVSPQSDEELQALLPAGVRPPSAAWVPETWWQLADPGGRPLFPCGEAGQGGASGDQPLSLVVSPLGGGKVNILTADPALVTQLAARNGLAGQAALLAAVRADGRLPAQPLDLPQERPPFLVVGADRWQVRVQVRVGDMQRAWLVVMAAAGNQVRQVACYVIA